VVADITKIGTESFCNIGDITTADVLVTNETTDPEKLRLLEKIREAGVTVKFARD
jgi:DeoR/GlpR family transcriptional regulator of sugar metabolism